jgi:hypothetical protein
MSVPGVGAIVAITFRSGGRTDRGSLTQRPITEGGIGVSGQIRSLGHFFSLDKPLNTSNYSVMLWISLAVAVSAPLPTNLHDWFSSKDLPAYVTQRGLGPWTVGVRVTVEPDGKIQGCAIEFTSGIPDLDGLTCRLIADRAKFEQARWIDGSAILGIYRTSVEWAVANPFLNTPKMSNADIDVFVQNLPSGVHSPALIRTMFAVDASGRISSCIAEPGPALEQIDNNSALASVACDQLTRGYKAIPAKDSSGNAIPSVQDAQVRFSVNQPQRSREKVKSTIIVRP